MIQVSVHAVERYVERVKPCATPEQAKAECAALLEHFAAFTTEKPDWHDPGLVHEAFDCYALVADGIAFGIRGMVAVTCLTRGGHSEIVREAKNRRAAARRGRARAMRNKRTDSYRTRKDRAKEKRGWDAAA